MQTRLSRAAAPSRMRGDIEAAIEYLPGLASLALWCEFADTDENGVVAYTDGKTIYAGAEYETREPRTRRFIVLHEILHIALCHPQRFAEVKKRDVSFCPRLLNIAADAIINGSLADLTGITAPPDAWTLGKIWQALEQSDSSEPVKRTPAPAYYSFTGAQPPRKIAGFAQSEFVRVNRWSCEELYYFLKAQTNANAAVYETLVKLYAEDSLGQDLRQDTTKDGAQPLNSASQTTASAPSAVLSEEKRSWQGRLNLLRGSLPELCSRLAGELPRVETPWEQVLRSVLQTAFQESVIADYSRPSRRWLALERGFQADSGVLLPFAPSARKKRAARLAVALDTSGSIDGELLNRFLAEIVALCELNQRDLILVIGDAMVHSVEEIEWREASERLREIKYTGGGGTDFRPLIAEAGKHEPDALIYLTDLYGASGDAPDFPVIWACVPGASGDAAWGERIELK